MFTPVGSGEAMTDAPGGDGAAAAREDGERGAAGDTGDNRGDAADGDGLIEVRIRMLEPTVMVVDVSAVNVAVVPRVVGLLIP